MVKTIRGVVMGTVPYMSPEQALGATWITAPTYSAWVCCSMRWRPEYRHSPGANSSETLDRILHLQPEAISRFNHEVPSELERIVGKCLEKDRERRYSSARELLADLKNRRRDLEVGAPATGAKSQERQRRLLTSRAWLAISALLMLAVAALGYLLLFRGMPTAVYPKIKSIAVLPLENLSGDPAQEYSLTG